MHVAYVDDAGDVQTLTPGSEVPPVLIFGAVALDTASLAQLTRDFLALKRRFFQGRMKSAHLLDDVLVEVKGAELRTMVRKSRRARRHAIHFFHELLQLLEGNNAQVFGRVWVKAMNTPLNGTAVNNFSIQSVCETYQNFLNTRNDDGLMIVDSSTPGLNASVSHSIFTQRFRAAGDKYSRLVEMPTFGHSQNHVGLQIADIVASGLVAPMASISYCKGYVTGVHVHAQYSELKYRYGERLRKMQHRYLNVAGSWSGGYSVSDPVNKAHGGHLFQ